MIISIFHLNLRILDHGVSKFLAIELAPRRDEARGEINKVVARGGGGKTDVKGRSLGLITGETKKCVAPFPLPPSSQVGRLLIQNTILVLLSWLVDWWKHPGSAPEVLSVLLIVISNMENMQLTYFLAPKPGKADGPHDRLGVQSR